MNEPSERIETERNRPLVGSMAAQISNRIVSLHAQYSGRGPTKARTTLNTNFALVVMRDVLTRTERTLAENGKADEVAQMRGIFEEAIRAEAVGAVQEITGRKVTTGLDTIDVEQDVSVLVYLFETAPESGIVVVADAEVDDPQ